jgi:hypothetical protein
VASKGRIGAFGSAMSTNKPSLPDSPSNFYLRNPLSLLVDKCYLEDDCDGDSYVTRLKSADGGDGSFKNGTSKNESNEVFIGRDTSANGLILELSGLIDKNQQVIDFNRSIETKNQGESEANHSIVPRKNTPYQIMYSSTFQCYTSLAFYGALLTQLRTWIKALDAACNQKRALVWSHLFAMVDSQQSSSDALTPVLQSILSQPKMSLLDIELLYLAVLLAVKLAPTLLLPSAPSSVSSSSSTSMPSPSSNHLGTPDTSHASSESHPNSTVAVSISFASAHSALETVGEAEATDLDTKKQEEIKLAPKTNDAPDNGLALSSVPPVATESPFVHSKEAIVANATDFYQAYRKRVHALHEELISSVALQRAQTLASLPPGFISAGASSLLPSKEDLILALSLRQLATLGVWIPLLEKLSDSRIASLSAAVQTVPALSEAFSTASPSDAASSTSTAATVMHNLTAMHANWMSLPQRHIPAISALYNAICMLRDFGLYDPKAFLMVKYEKPTSPPLPLNASAAAPVPAQSTTPATLTPSATAGAPPNLTAAQLSALFAMPGTGAFNPLSAAGALANNPNLIPFMNASAAWGTSPLPAWSPVPSPLTTFPGPYGSLSPLNFVARASPLSLGSNALAPQANATKGHTGAFSSAAPTGVVLPKFATNSNQPRAAPTVAVPNPLHLSPQTAAHSHPSTSASSLPSTARSLLGGRSAFGALKRAAEEEAENDVPAKRPKLTEI